MQEVDILLYEKLSSFNLIKFLILFLKSMIYKLQGIPDLYSFSHYICNCRIKK